MCIFPSPPPLHSHVCIIPPLPLNQLSLSSSQHGIEGCSRPSGLQVKAPHSFSCFCSHSQIQGTELELLAGECAGECAARPSEAGRSQWQVSTLSAAASKERLLWQTAQPFLPGARPKNLEFLFPIVNPLPDLKSAIWDNVLILSWLHRQVW